MFKGHRLFVALTVSVSFLAGCYVLLTPVPSKNISVFSAIEAARYIEAISREPHSVFDRDAHGRVHDYLIEKLGEFIDPSRVQEMNYSTEQVEAVVGRDLGADYPLKNILAKIPGASKTAIMLAGHYDSQGLIGRSGELGRSYGAADAGYALATMLEIARLYGKDRALRNTIYLLVTDAEEVGMLGAKMAARESALMANVGFIINIEARGIKGPAYMFETSPQNRKVIDFYRRAHLPVSYSLATAVYQVMPNYTDFTEFLSVGRRGVNFAVLDDLSHYHTPLDNYASIDLSSIQHYGSQIVPMVEEFVRSDRYSDVNYFADAQNKVFFTILPGVFVSYTETAATLVHFFILAVWIGLVIWLSVRKEIKLFGVLKYLGFIVGAIAASGLAGLVLSKGIAWAARVPWSLTHTNMSGAGWPALIIVLGAIAGLILALKKFVPKTKWPEAALAGIILNIILATVSGFLLSGGSFLFLVPALTGLLGLVIRAFIKQKWIRQLAYSQTILWNMLLLVPVLYSFFLALTIGGLPALLVILVINLSVVLPIGLLAYENA